MNPVNNKFVKVNFDSSTPNSDYQDKKCILLISVGQKYHESDKLAATIELINKSKFKSCVVAVADTLQRHNYSNMSPHDSYHRSLKSGDEWLERNFKIIDNLTATKEILRWDTALQDENYPALRKKIEVEYAKNKIYRDAVNSTISKFTDRIIKRDEKLDFDTVFSNGLKYLIEECPIIMPLWACQGYDYIIYPQPMTNAMSMTRDIFVKPQLPDKAQWLSLKFKKLCVLSNEESWENPLRAIG
jgi:tRNA-dependent cyclodipeptide synthase